MKGLQLMFDTVSQIDEQNVRVRLPTCDNLRTVWLPVLQRNTQNNKDYGLPDVSEQVSLLLDADGDDGVVLGAVYSEVDRPTVANHDKRRVDFVDGTVVEYDRKNHAMTIGGQYTDPDADHPGHCANSNAKCDGEGKSNPVFGCTRYGRDGQPDGTKATDLPGRHERVGRQRRSSHNLRHASGQW